MTLLKSLPALHEYLITALETMLVNELMMEYVTTSVMHKMLKHKEEVSKAKI